MVDQGLFGSPSVIMWESLIQAGHCTAKIQYTQRYDDKPVISQETYSVQQGYNSLR